MSYTTTRQAFVAISEIASIVNEDTGEGSSCTVKMKDGREFHLERNAGGCYEEIEDRIRDHRLDPFIEFRVR